MNPNVIKDGKECVLLVEGDVFHPAVVDATKQVGTIVTREWLSDTQHRERVWQWRHGERAESGQRVFREHLAPTLADDLKETPRYDELVIKEPLRFTSRMTPNGFGPDGPKENPRQLEEIRPLMKKLQD